MNRYIPIAALLAVTALSGCATQQQQQVLTVACTADKLAPAAVTAGGTIAMIANPTTIAAVSAANAADQALHPLVQAACDAALTGSVPVAGTVTVSSVPVAPVIGQTNAVILPVSK